MSFSQDIQLFVDKFDRDAEKILRGIILSIDAKLIQRSPVDTGRFRANWNYGIGVMDLTVTNVTDPSGSLALSKLNSGVELTKLGDIVHITNNLPYAIPLEFGHSEQAPNGMVRITAAESSGIVRNINV